ncbi:MAG: hypothetical protein V3T56_05815 [Gemmatimonadales bacterium]
MSKRGSVLSAMGWMIGLSAVLFWLPVFGSLIAGYVGGRKAGSWGRAVMAAILPGFLFAVIGGLITGLIGWIPIIGGLWGALAGLGGVVIGAAKILPLMIGAVLGGLSPQD